MSLQNMSLSTKPTTSSRINGGCSACVVKNAHHLDSISKWSLLAMTQCYPSPFPVGFWDMFWKRYIEFMSVTWLCERCFCPLASTVIFWHGEEQMVSAALCSLCGSATWLKDQGKRGKEKKKTERKRIRESCRFLNNSFWAFISPKVIDRCCLYLSF